MLNHPFHFAYQSGSTCSGGLSVCSPIIPTHFFTELTILSLKWISPTLTVSSSSDAGFSDSRSFRRDFRLFIMARRALSGADAISFSALWVWVARMVRSLSSLSLLAFFSLLKRSSLLQIFSRRSCSLADKAAWRSAKVRFIPVRISPYFLLASDTRLSIRSSCQGKYKQKVYKIRNIVYVTNTWQYRIWVDSTFRPTFYAWIMFHFLTKKKRKKEKQKNSSLFLHAFAVFRH